MNDNPSRDADNDPADVPRGQPAGLWVLFITEMWERFSYYGMRALLALYLAHTTVRAASDAGVIESGADPGQGFGWTEANASILYGVYTFMVYLTSIFGGLAADRFLGTHRSMLAGGTIIALGHICLAFTALFTIPDGAVVSPETAPGALGVFLAGLALIIIGTGFFKPCVSVMVGQLYQENDPRRDSGFTIFYMGINVGAFLSPLVAGTLGERVGWHWGFGAAAVGMILGLVFYMIYRPKYLKGIGDPPDISWSAADLGKFLLVSCSICAIPIVPLVLFMTGTIMPIVNVWNSATGALGVYGTAIVIVGGLLVAAGVFLARQMPAERSRIAVILILAVLGNIFFWTAFEQAGTSLNFFAKNSTDRTIFGYEFPATWYQSVNAFTIVIFAPFFSFLWVWLARRKKDPSTPMKFAIGLWLLGLSFIAMIFGSLQARDGGLAAPYWLLITYIVYTWGELCLSPVGLSMVTKLAPKRLQSLLMGLWFLSFALSNLLAGLVAAFSTKFVPAEGETTAELSFIIPGLPGFYLMLVVFPIAAGLVIAILTPVLRKMMKGIH